MQILVSKSKNKALKASNFPTTNNFFIYQLHIYKSNKYSRSQAITPRAHVLIFPSANIAYIRKFSIQTQNKIFVVKILIYLKSTSHLWNNNNENTYICMLE